MGVSLNFEFIRSFMPELADLGAYAENILYADPGSAQTRLRSFAEQVTRFIHRFERLPIIPQADFNTLLIADSFCAVANNTLRTYLHTLRKEGNRTAHGEQGDLATAQNSLQIAYQLACYLALKYFKQDRDTLPEFKPVQDTTQLNKKQQQELAALRRQMDELQEALQQANLKAQHTQQESSLAEREQSLQQSQRVADSLSWDEATTRRHLIDRMLRQAGWDLANTDQVTLEELVLHQPTSSGQGRADYVLWDENHKPLAVVEAKRSAESMQQGREQARMYADGLEKMFGLRPVIFYTNGYETWIWDDSFYNSYRQVYGFYSRKSLQYLLYQRVYRDKNLEAHNPKLSIAGRPYQIEAIKSIAHRFQQQRRHALIVQATGTGKTRVAIAICELLNRTGWAKRILFLCDRRELRKQADKAFKEYLPSEPRCVVGEHNKLAPDARIYIATYPGMMGRFQQLDVGYFDLIIADESHRSIYNKYRDLFLYFDALQLGLTATPVKFIARNTFELFGCEDQDPTFEYSLNDAINNDPPYLVPFRVKDVTNEFLREGIHYNELTPEQRQQLEQDLGEEQAKQTRIKKEDIGRRLFSRASDQLILQNLMQHGIKDSTHSLVGKSIIFAQSQEHAEQLEKLFVELYPQYGCKVCKVIHNKVSRNEALIEEFKDAKGKGAEFRIAISVDMLDTGIDIPEVVNLVFAKPVRSWVKFWQMVGRGTRLCEHLFGHGKHKKEFFIFDHYGNFEFFEEEYREVEDSTSKSLLQQLFEARLNLLEAAIQFNQREAFDLSGQLIRQDLQELPEASINVKQRLRDIHQLTQSNALLKMEVATRHSLSQLACLMGSRTLKDKDAVDFDLLICNIQQSLLQQDARLTELKQILLQQLALLPVTLQIVRQHDALIKQASSAEFWQQPTTNQLENLRLQLRHLMKYRVVSGGGVMQVQSTKVESAGEGIYHVERQVKLLEATEQLAYRRKLKDVLEQMLNSNPILQKIHHNEAIKEEELNTLISSILTQHPGVDLTVLNQFYGRTAQQLTLTIRELIGLEPNAVEQHFTDFLHQHPSLTHKQVQFINLLKTYISENGCISFTKLYEPPFTRVAHEGIDGVFSECDIEQLVAVLKPFWVEEGVRG